MRPPSSPLAALPLLIAALALPAAAQDETRYISAKDLAAKVAKLENGLATAALPSGPQVLIARRDRTGEVEVHAKLADQFIVQDGTATVLVGGRVEGGRETAPNERRGGEIVGGTRYAVGPGDVMWIPAGLPHQVIVPAGKSFTYIVGKHEAKQP